MEDNVETIMTEGQFRLKTKTEEGQNKQKNVVNTMEDGQENQENCVYAGEKCSLKKNSKRQLNCALLRHSSANTFDFSICDASELIYFSDDDCGEDHILQSKNVSYHQGTTSHEFVVSLT